MPTITYKFVADEAGLTTKLAGVKVKLDEVDKSAASAKEKTADLGKQFSAAKEGASALAAGLSRVNPELGAMGNAASAALGVLKSIGAAAGPVGAALAAGAAVAAAAYSKLSADLDQAEQNALDASQAAIKAQLGIVDKSIYVNKALEENERASLLKREGQWRAFARSYAEIFSLGGLNPVATAVIKQLDEMDAAQAENVRLAEAARDRNIELAKAAMDVAEAKKEETKATKKSNDERAREIELAQEYLDNQADLTAERKRQASIDKENDRVASVLAEARASAELVEAHGTLKEQEEERKKQAKATAVAWIDAGQTISSSVASLFGDNKAAAIASATVNAALAITKTFAELGFPAGVPAAVAVGAETAAQIAAIARTQPTFHSGSGEVQAVLQTGEAVLNRATASAIGKDTINAMNRGDRGMGGAITANVVGHRTMDRWWVKSVSRIHSPTRAAIQKLDTGVRPGRRRRL